MNKQKDYIVLRKRVWLTAIFLLTFSVTLTAQTLIGDADGNGVINIVDALLVAQHTVGINTKTFDAAAADVNGNGSVEITDALMIAQFYVGIIKEFPRKTPAPPNIDYLKVVRDWAGGEKIDLTPYVIELIESPEAGYILPGYRFCLILLRQYPVGMCCPDERLGMTCLVAINSSLRVELIPDVEALISFYAGHQIKLAGEKDLVLGIKAWLSLSQELKNDGYFTFVIPDENITIDYLESPLPEYIVIGESHVLSGGEGIIKASAIYGAGGILITVSEKVELITGVRPICQSTKLLDADPVVRGMAEQDLLSMGLRAKKYLDDMRPGLSPALQEAVDRVWEKILLREEKRQRILKILSE